MICPININKTERIVRIALGIILLGVAYFTKNSWFFLGIIPFLTGVIGYCPIYSILKRK